MANVKHILQSHPHWKAVEEIYHTLQGQGYKAFLAGGCVRDALMGVMANDLDVATDAKPEQIEKLFAKTVAVGKSFGVMRVLIGEADIEVATFRSDGAYVDGRRPSEVHFSSPEMDAQRRDFTVNALFFDMASDQVLDFVHGQEDLKKKNLTTVGVAEDRFAEDHLRLLRAARFVAQLNFNLSESTALAVQKMADKVNTVSGERLHDEMAKLLRSAGADKGLKVLVQSGMMKVLFPFRGHDGGTEYLNLANNSWQSFALFFKKASKEELKTLLSRLRFSVKEQRAIERSWDLWQHPEEFMKLSFGQKLLKMADEGMPWALAILKAQGRFQSEVQSLETEWGAWGQELPKAFLSGSDVQGLQGKAIGLCLAQAYELQLERKIATRDEALKWLQNYKEKV